MLELKSHKGWYKQSAEKCRYDKRTNQVLLPTGCCYQSSVVTNQVLLPTGSCYQLGFVTNRVLFPTRCCYQPGVVTNSVLLSTGCCYQIITYLTTSIEKTLIYSRIFLHKIITKHIGFSTSSIRIHPNFPGRSATRKSYSELIPRSYCNNQPQNTPKKVWQSENRTSLQLPGEGHVQ